MRYHLSNAQNLEKDTRPFTPESSIALFGQLADPCLSLADIASKNKTSIHSLAAYIAASNSLGMASDRLRICAAVLLPRYLHVLTESLDQALLESG